MKHLASLIVLAVLISGCVETSLIYSPNTYQSGKTSGRGQTKLKTGISVASIIKSADSTDNESVHDVVMTDWGGSDPALAFTVGVAYGVGERVDLGGTLALGFNGAPFSSLALRPYGKWMLTKPARRFAFSVMPALCFVLGSTDKQEVTFEASHEEIRSHAEALELHLPMSIQTGAHSAFTWTPHLVQLTYAVDYEHVAVTMEGDYQLNSKLERTGAGLSVGWILRGLQPEASILCFAGERPLYSIGVGAHP